MEELKKNGGDLDEGMELTHKKVAALDNLGEELEKMTPEDREKFTKKWRKKFSDAGTKWINFNFKD